MMPLMPVPLTLTASFGDLDLSAAQDIDLSAAQDIDLSAVICDLSGLSQDQLAELYREITPEGAELPAAEGLMLAVSRQLSNDADGSLNELADNLLEQIHAARPIPPAPDRSASLLRCEEPVTLAQLRLEASMGSHGLDDGEQVLLKSRKIDIEVLATTEDDQLALKALLQVELSIVYESGLPVDELAHAEEPLIQVLGTRQPWLVDGKAKFEVKVNVLSSMRNMQKFRLEIGPVDPATRKLQPSLRCYTQPIKTLSKLPRRKALGTDAASRALRREDEKRRAEEAQLQALMRDRLPDHARAHAVTPPEPVAALASAAVAAAVGADVAGAGAALPGKEDLRSRVQEQERHIEQLQEENSRMLRELEQLRDLTRTEPPPADATKRTRE